MKTLLTFSILLYSTFLFSQYNYGLDICGQDAKIEGKLNLNDGQGNAIIGNNSGTNITTGVDNVIIGEGAGFNFTSGARNTIVGSLAGFSNQIGQLNTFIGGGAGYLNRSSSNTLIGDSSFGDSSTGGLNVVIGTNAGRYTDGSQNVYIGNNSGFSVLGQNNNILYGRNGSVFIGYKSGEQEINSDRLYIENSESALPLIYGEFDNDKAGINWNSSIPLPATLSINGTLHISETAKLEPQTTAPSTCTTAAEYGLMYYDNSSTTHKLKVCTNAGWEDLN